MNQFDVAIQNLRTKIERSRARIDTLERQIDLEMAVTRGPFNNHMKEVANQSIQRIRANIIILNQQITRFYEEIDDCEFKANIKRREAMMMPYLNSRDSECKFTEYIPVDVMKMLLQKNDIRFQEERTMPNTRRRAAGPASL